MTTITIERKLLEQALGALTYLGAGFRRRQRRTAAVAALRAALSAPAGIAEEMTIVADRFAHKLALDLECVLADYSGTWYDTAINTLGAYREAMNAIHERENPTFMGEPVLSSDELANQEKTSSSPIVDYSDCHGPDWRDRDGEYLK